MNKNLDNVNRNPKVGINFKLSDNEVYMIKDQNFKRIHDILKNSFTAKPPEDCSVIKININ